MFSTFGDNLLWSLKISGLTLFLNVLISLPAGYAIVRKSFPGKRLLFSLLTLPLYVPGAVIGISLILTYNFTYHLTTSMWGLVFAMTLGTFPLMLTPIVVAMKDLPIVFEEAAACLGASSWQTYRKIVFPLIGPGISAGLLLSFIIVFNEYLVTLFVHPPGHRDRAAPRLQPDPDRRPRPDDGRPRRDDAGDLVPGGDPVLPDLRDPPSQGHLHPLMSTVRLASVTKHYGSTIAVHELDLDVADGELVTLLGPSGCGKTTTLRMVAGLIEPTAGRIWFDDQDVTFIPPRARNIGFVFQTPALFPHLSVADNVAFGLSVKGRPKAAIRDRVAEMLAMVGLPEYGARMPAQMSGGQQQRVALARVLATDPRVLLFDEPLSALDRNLRDTLKYSILELQRRTGKTAIYVTHDQSEAFAISDRIVVMNAGRVEQIGTQMDIYLEPRTPFVAEFIGANNVLPGVVEGVAQASGGGDADRRREPGHRGRRHDARRRPRPARPRTRRSRRRRPGRRLSPARGHPVLDEGAPADAGNVVEADVERVIFEGPTVQLRVRVGDRPLRVGRRRRPAPVHREQRREAPPRVRRPDDHPGDRRGGRCRRWSPAVPSRSPCRRRPRERRRTTASAGRLPDRLRPGARRRAAGVRPPAVPRRHDGRPVAALRGPLAGPHLAGVHLVETLELDDLVALERDACPGRARSSGSAAARRSTSRSSSPGRAGCRSSRSRPRRRSTRRSAIGPGSATTAASATSAGRSPRPSTSTST